MYRLAKISQARHALELYDDTGRALKTKRRGLTKQIQKWMDKHNKKFEKIDINWNALPENLLLHIFLQLNYDSLLICKLISKRWFEVIMTAKVLSKYRCLYFVNCLIEPNFAPVSVLCCAKYPYNVLVLDQNSLQVSRIENLERQLKYIGREIDTIKYFGRIDSYALSIFNLLPVVRKFCTTDCSIKDLVTIAEYKSVNLKEFFAGIREIKYFNYTRLNKLDFKNIIAYFPALQKLNYYNPGCPSTLDMRLFMFEHKILCKKITISTFLMDSNREAIHKILMTKDIEKLIQIDDEKLTRFHLNDFLTFQPHIQKTYLYSYNSFPFIFPENLRELWIEINFEPRTFNFVVKLKNLKKLTIKEHTYKTTNCIKWHMAYVNSNVKKLDLLLQRMTCKECHENIIKSFPNTEFYVLDVGSAVLAKGTIAMLITNLLNLKTLRIYIATNNHKREQYEVQEDLNLSIQNFKHLNLQTLDLSGLRFGSIMDFKFIEQIFPNLYTFSMHTTSFVTPNEVLKAFSGILLARLRHFTYNNSISGFSTLKRDVKKVKEKLSLCKKLRTLTLTSIDVKTDAHLADSLLGKLTSLVSVTFINPTNQNKATYTKLDYLKKPHKRRIRSEDLPDNIMYI